MHIIIHTDGGSRGNPGPAASAFTVHTKNNEVLHEEARFLGNTTNNVAEYSALRMALEWLSQNAVKHGVEKVEILMDSELVVKQMRGEYKIKDANLSLIAHDIKRIERDLSLPLAYIHVRRAENAQADLLVNQALDAQK